MELDIRKQKILNAIIQNYQETGEPVGSRTIAKYLDPVSYTHLVCFFLCSGCCRLCWDALLSLF